MDSLYFGFLQVALTSIDGEAVGYGSSDDSPVTPASRAAALARQAPPTHLGPEYANLHVVPVPRVDVILAPSSDGMVWPSELVNPLVKVESGPVQGFKSGVRSALVHCPSRGAWFRLKGCGNNTDGFTGRDLADETGAPVLNPATGSPLHEIRGAAFEHTAAIELRMSKVVDDLLAPLGMRCANRPVGLYKYTLPTAPCPLVARCCAVFQTAGDRRLTDHVLRGLELLLPSMASLSPMEPVLSHFPEGAFGPRCLTAPEDLEMNTTHMQFACGGRDEPRVFADFSNFPLILRAPAAADFPANAPENLREIWTSAAAALDQHLAAKRDSGSALLGQLYWQFGRECGAVMRAFQSAEISWGTFRDKSGTHCNAHGNNFVLLSDTINHGGDPSAPFLAPLDLDFAYSRGTAVFTNDAALDAVQAAENLALEPSALGMDLGMYAGSSGTRNDHAVGPSTAPLHWGLRDTLVKSYLSALAGADEAPLLHSARMDAETRRAADSLLRLALITTWDVIA